MRRAFFVCGPESSGNRLMVSMLVDAGCWGRGKIDQPIDGSLPDYPIVKPEPQPDRLAFYRSFPHGGHWPNFMQIVSNLRAWGYRDTTVLVMVRDQYAIERSQVRAGHVSDLNHARQNTTRAYKEIFFGVTRLRLPFVIVSYARLGVPEYRQWITETLRLPKAPTIEWTNEDTKYYGQV